MSAFAPKRTAPGGPKVSAKTPASLAQIKTGAAGGLKKLPSPAAGAKTGASPPLERKEAKDGKQHEKKEPSVPIAASPDLNKLVDAAIALVKAGASTDLEAKLAEIRKAILIYGINDTSCSSDGLRCKTYKLLLGVNRVDSDEYIRMVEKKQSEKYQKTKDDCFRTFKGDEVARARITDAQLVRFLNAFTHKYTPSFKYLQGMNTLAGAFLWCMPELEAWYAFSAMITKRFPMYWVSAYIGAEAGCSLVNEVLAVVDPELATHLRDSGQQAYLYAFHAVSSLSASVKPFSELLKLLDFFVAFGPHLNVLCVCAQMVSWRDDLLKSGSESTAGPGGGSVTNKLDSRNWPPLNARRIIALAMGMVPLLPPDLWQRICAHITDPKVASEIVGRDIEYVPLKEDS